MELNLEEIIIDDDIQQRVEMHQSVIRDYAEAMKRGDKFPPVLVYSDGKKHWLSDGFHRIQAAKNTELKTIEAEIREGDKLDALEYALGANAAHGLRRTNACKRKAVLTALTTPRWKKESNREIARMCRVSEGLVRIIKKELETNTIQVLAPIRKGDDKRSVFFMRCEGLKMERHGEPVFDYGTLSKKDELTVEIKSYTAGLRIVCHTDEYGIEHFDVWQVYYKDGNHKEIDWPKSFRLGGLSNEGFEYNFELSFDNDEGSRWTKESVDALYQEDYKSSLLEN
jgi:transposase